MKTVVLEIQNPIGEPHDGLNKEHVVPAKLVPDIKTDELVDLLVKRP